MATECKASSPSGTPLPARCHGSLPARHGSRERSDERRMAHQWYRVHVRGWSKMKVPLWMKRIATFVKALSEHKNIPIVVSLLALLVSGVSSYLQFFHSSHVITVSSYDIIYRESYYNAEFIVSNVGNKPVGLTDIHFCLVENDVRNFDSAESWTYVPTYVDDVYSDIVLSKSLTTIKPGEIRVFRLKSTFDFSHDTSNPRYQNNSFNIGICFNTYTSDARKKPLGIMPFRTKLKEDGKPYYPTRNSNRNIFQSEHRKVLRLAR